ncbi:MULTISPECIES: PEGA domain-containing protein [unclassified Methanoregula]|uniref:PEGA domain-containing protein n=1 Tax=unclassified Methanoregula TaxID=2649730 RepID=UPI0009CD7380|nr:MULTISPECIES: PEGA domain-containing protein [unclassified Methanoregula]OPX62169.1 MAG: PEGA domain protein [Methanoregula sp. PtaB.Bin085]OPY35622.1 MAG: PEGA domain protein [Methanoregula sp. PtaU1.Bin006]
MKRLAIPALLILLLVLVPHVPAAIGPSITGVTPISGPNNGVVTITVTGTGLDTTTVIRLNKCAARTGSTGQPAFSGTILRKDSDSVTAAFDLRNKVAGPYDVSLSALWEGQEVWAVSYASFSVYQASGQPDPVITFTIPPVTTTTTTAPTPQGKNSVLFDSNPPGAAISLDGERIGTTPFVYYTDKDGTFNVVAWKEGYAEYESKVTIYEGRRVGFLAPLTPRSAVTTTTVPTATSATTPATTAKTTATTAATVKTSSVPATGVPAGTTTEVTQTALQVTGTIYTPVSIVIPTPWPTDTPGAKKSSADPFLAPGAAALAILAVLTRRR